ncbi:DUF4221 domain-containing protein [Aquiflexum sp. LQ15W]|uniref:DUF4221 family protein n=1 Tax=Cognataquiflexum nitidum TaxID=2922272 RepID=UPI001F13F481|nr:DUF4221 family protein [Cognataquiflexum nitidum]MCH6200211.1 DUF4221 domain-containing protein [Cognataquiflexum nitidum]
MNKLFLLVAILILISCSKNNNENSTGAIGEINLEIDTVLVDSKGEVLMAGTYLSVFDLSEDKKYLYNFDPNTYQVEVIDLDKLEIHRKIQLEIEGPNRIGDYPNYLFALGNSELAFSNYMTCVAVNLNGEKTFEFNLVKDRLESDSLKSNESLYPDFLFIDGHKELYTMIETFGQNITTIGLVNTSTKTLKRIEIPQLEKLKNFRVLWKNGNARSLKAPLVTMGIWDKKILIANNTINEVIVYDPKSESISVKTFESKLTPNQKTPNEKVEVGTIQEFMAGAIKLNEQIEFGKLNWDPITKRFYRLSSISLPRPEGVETYKADVFLTVFDEELNMLWERKLDGFTKSPVTTFFKDGAIWIHENLNDELGFIRIKVLEN